MLSKQLCSRCVTIINNVYVKMGKKVLPTSEATGVSRGVIRKVISGFYNSSKTRGRKKFSSDARNIHVFHFIQDQFEKWPGMELEELRFILKDALKVNTSISNLSKICKLIGLSKKKMDQISFFKIHPRNRLQRTLFKIAVNQFDVRRFFYVDEVYSYDSDKYRKFGRSKKGTVCESRNFLSKGSCSLVVCFSYNKFITCTGLKTGGNTGIVQNTFSEELYIIFLYKLLKKLPFWAVITCDNVGFHKTQKIKQMCDYFRRTKGIVVISTPPYSPELHAIELMFGWCKAMFKVYSQEFDWRGKHILEYWKRALEEIPSSVIESFSLHCRRLCIKKDSKYDY